MFVLLPQGKIVLWRVLALSISFTYTLLPPRDLCRWGGEAGVGAVMPMAEGEAGEERMVVDNLD